MQNLYLKSLLLTLSATNLILGMDHRSTKSFNDRMSELEKERQLILEQYKQDQAKSDAQQQKIKKWYEDRSKSNKELAAETMRIMDKVESGELDPKDFEAFKEKMKKQSEASKQEVDSLKNETEALFSKLSLSNDI